MGCKKIYPNVANPNPSDQIGQVIEISNGCGPAGTVSNYLYNYIPQNGEYQWAGEGSGCHYCSVEAPIEVSCSAGCESIKCCSIAGKRGTYQRTGYNADPFTCCSTLPSSSMIGNLTCNPKYNNNYATGDCDGY